MVFVKCKAQEQLNGYIYVDSLNNEVFAAKYAKLYSLAHYTNDFPPQIQIWWNISFVVIRYLASRLLQFF